MIQLFLFGWMSLVGGSQNSLVLITFGAKFNFSIQFLHEYWRFITPMFLHIGLEHLVINSLFLYFLGNQMESLLGPLRFAFVYLLSGIMGNVASFAFNPSISAGASTALFGLLGSIVYLSQKHGYIRYFKELGMRYMSLIVINIILGFLNPGVDNFGHLGGLVGGYLISAVLSFKGDRQTTVFQRFLAGMGYIFIVIFLFGLGMKASY